MDKSKQMSIFEGLDESQSVDKFKNKKKRKQLEINVDNSIVELNLLLLPLAPVGRERSDIGTIIVKWTDSQGNLRGIKVSMVEGYNMLTRFDINILMSLQKLYSEQNRVISYNFESKKYDMPIEIKYTIREIAKALKYKSCSGVLVSKIKKAIRKLANCTITSLFAGGLYDSENDVYIKEKGFHIIETYDMYERTNLDKNDKILRYDDIKEYNKIVINSFFYKSMCNGYFKIVPFDQLIRLKHDVSQRIFSILEGWYCEKKPFVYFNYKTLYERIPLNPISKDDKPMEVKDKNRAIKTACEELLRNGYIQSFILVRNKGVYFIFDSELKDANIETINATYYGHHKYSGLKDVIKTYLQYGIEENQIDLYVKQSNIEYHKALLRYYDMMVRYDKIKENPINYLLKGIKGNYNIDKKYYNTVNDCVK